MSQKKKKKLNVSWIMFEYFSINTCNRKKQKRKINWIFFPLSSLMYINFQKKNI